jgi:hypothetical protein
MIGSTPTALFAGRLQAITATTPNETVTASKIGGSLELPCDHFASTLFNAKVSTTPSTIPLPTLPTMDVK